MQPVKLEAGNTNGQSRASDPGKTVRRTARAGAPPGVTLWRSFGFAFVGLGYVLKTQRNAKIHAVLTGMVIGLGLWLQVTALQWAILALTIGLVFSAEMFNTVIEALVDLVSPTFHPLAKVAKDVAAGAVLLLAITGCVVGLFIFGPGLWRLVLDFLRHVGGG